MEVEPSPGMAYFVIGIPFCVVIKGLWADDPHDGSES